MPDNRGQRHPNVRSADSAVVKAVEHQAALERQAQQRQEQARLARNQAMPQRMPRPANVTRPTYQRPAQAMPQRQGQPVNMRQQMPQQRPVQAMPQRQPQPTYQRPVQPVNARQQVPSSQNQAILRRDAQPYAQPVMQPVPQRLQIPQQPRPVNQAMPVLHTSTQQLNTRMPVPHRPAQSPNANMPVVRSVPQTIAMPRHVSNPGEERRELESLMEEEQYDELQEDGIVEADSEYEEFDDDEEEEVVEKKHRRSRERKQRKHRYLPYLIVLLLEILIAGAAVWAITVFNEDTDLIVTQNTIEAGSSADLSMFLTGNARFPEYVSCNLDFSTVNYVLPQTIRFNIRMYGVNFPLIRHLLRQKPYLTRCSLLMRYRLWKNALRTSMTLTT